MSTDVNVIRPVTRRVRVPDIWRTWRVVRIVALRDIKIKYKQSALGPLWLLIQPIGLLAAVTIAFNAVTNVDTGNIPYQLFALVGLAVWTFFQLTFSAATVAMVSNSVLIRRSQCPRVSFITAAVFSNLPPLLVMLAVTLGWMIIRGDVPLSTLALPLMILWLFVLCWGTVTLVASIAARFRDVIAMVPLIIQGGLFVSPVGYPVNSGGKGLSTLLAFNPLTGLIEAWRWCLLGTHPAVWMLYISLGVTLALAVFAWRVFARMEVDFADYI